MPFRLAELPMQARRGLTTFRRLAKYGIMTAVFRALSDPTRRRVLEILREGPRTAGELAAEFNVSKPTMSAHFAVLREAGLVVSEKNGKTVVYQLEMSVLEETLLGFARSFGYRLETNVRPERARSGRKAKET
jgi:DNA-binding transcriptional ArsR family regulator